MCSILYYDRSELGVSLNKVIVDTALRSHSQIRYSLNGLRNLRTTCTTGYYYHGTTLPKYTCNYYNLT